jgi:L-alanine-DL-glutamate epimerase-like enolase superfamily enzyme
MKKLTAEFVRHKLKKPFVIARGNREFADTVEVTIEDNGVIGRASSVPYQRYGETCDSVLAEINAIKGKIESGASITELQNLLPAGAARNAVDCAMWDIESQRTNKPLWQLFDLPDPTAFNDLDMAFTLSIADPEVMGNEASQVKEALIKVKCAGDGRDMERIATIRKNAPKKKILIDPNESWTDDNYATLLSQCEKEGVSVIEQPMAVKKDTMISKVASTILICADESCHTSSDLPALAGKYDMVNIKLDKTGGLTEAVTLIKQARKMNFRIMVGCMLGPELAMKPARALLGDVDVVDLDGPMFLA